MKAVATAFVLIAGAAVVLWYGNTLNSWVLGGLIGGLAALLLSIPISLTIFSFFSRRHNERYGEEQASFMQEKISLAQHGSYHARYGYTTRVEPDFYDMEDPEYIEEDYQDYDEFAEEKVYDEEALEGYPQHFLPASSPHSPESSRRPITRQSEKKHEMTQRLPTRQAGYTGLPGYAADPQRSRYRSKALRVARQEAARQSGYYHEEEASPPFPRQYGARSKRLPPSYDNPRSSRANSDSFSPESTNRNVRPSRRIVDSFPPQPSHHTHPLSEDEATHFPDNYAGITEEDQEALLRRPLQRRAPYTYEDDSLRQNMARHTERPVIRRSSRALNQYPDDSTR